ncbi:hypothetical protein [Teredinibacter turnerae]|uniref:hypothetical protein n=1 Tax=Teredinibacter turnerae TaxID=2426 RepID=UPI0030D5D618
MKFEDLNLHDATINSVSYLWEGKTLTVQGEYFSVEKGEPIGFALSFHGVTCVSLPHQEEWGASASINGTKFSAPTTYSIEIQSGDVITIEAAGYKFSGKIT